MKMKTVMLICMLFVLGIVLSGCAEIPVDFAEFDPGEVASVQLYHDMLDCSVSTSGAFVQRTPVEALDPSLNEAFLQDLSLLNFTEFVLFFPAAIDPSFTLGEWIVRINLTDGSYWAISAGGCNEYYNAAHENTGGNHFGLDDGQWEWLIKKYFPIAYADITDETYTDTYM